MSATRTVTVVSASREGAGGEYTTSFTSDESYSTNSAWSVPKNLRSGGGGGEGWGVLDGRLARCRGAAAALPRP